MRAATSGSVQRCMRSSFGLIRSASTAVQFLSLVGGALLGEVGWRYAVPGAVLKAGTDLELSCTMCHGPGQCFLPPPHACHDCHGPFWYPKTPDPKPLPDMCSVMEPCAQCVLLRAARAYACTCSALSFTLRSCHAFAVSGLASGSPTALCSIRS